MSNIDRYVCAVPSYVLVSMESKASLLLRNVHLLMHNIKRMHLGNEKRVQSATVDMVHELK